MEPHEGIQDMFTRFTNIVNKSKGLGKAYSNEELVRKILRSLPPLFDPKVTAIEESNNLSDVSLENLVGNLLTHEARLRERQDRSDEEKPKKKNLAFKAEREKKKKESSSSSSSSSEEEVELLVKAIGKFFRTDEGQELLQGKGSKRFNKSKKDNSDSETETNSLCRYCRKPGHIWKDCYKRKNDKKKKSLKADIQDQKGENESSSGSSSDGQVKSHQALMALENFLDEVSDYDSESEEEVKDPSYDELFEQYGIMCIEAEKLVGKYKDLKKEHKSLKKEHSNLKNENENLLEKLNAIPETSFMSSNAECVECAKFKELNVELNSQVTNLSTQIEEELQVLEKLAEKYNKLKISNKELVREYNALVEEMDDASSPKPCNECAKLKETCAMLTEKLNNVPSSSSNSFGNECSICSKYRDLNVELTEQFDIEKGKFDFEIAELKTQLAYEQRKFEFRCTTLVTENNALKAKLFDLEKLVSNFTKSSKGLNMLLSSSRFAKPKTGLGYSYSQQQKKFLPTPHRGANLNVLSRQAGASSIVCTLCGRLGHFSSACCLQNRTKIVKQIWVPKGTIPDQGGPFWIPKTKLGSFL